MEITYKSLLTFSNMAGRQGRIERHFNSQEQMETKTRETGEGKINHMQLSVQLCYIKSYLNAVSKTKSMDEPKVSTKITLLFNIAWEQACHRLMNLKIIFNLRTLNKFNAFTQSLIACLRQKLFLQVSRSIWNLANLRSNSTL